MEKYNLDEKGGLFKFNVKSPAKVVKKGDGIELRHFGVFNPVKASVSDVTESTVKVQSKEKIPEISFSPGDPIVLNYNPSGDFFVVTGEVASVDGKDPLEATVKVAKIEKLKDLVKEKKYCVSLTGSVKIIGVPESKFAAVKNISFGGIKVNCKEDIMMEDIIDTTILLDKTNKMSFKARVVRKNKLNDSYEYGLEYSEIPESSSKLLHHLMYQLETMG